MNLNVALEEWPTCPLLYFAQRKLLRLAGAFLYAVPDRNLPSFTS